MTNKEKTLKKIRNEMEADIAQLIELSKKTSLLDLENLIYLIFINKIVMMNSQDELTKIRSFMHEETYKYLSQLFTKYGKKAYPYGSDTGKFIFDPHFLQEMISRGNRLNSKYEAQAVIKLLDTEVIKAKDKETIKVSFDKIKENHDFIALLDYAHRIYIDNSIKKETSCAYRECIGAYIEEFSPYADLFLAGFGMEFSLLVDFLSSLLGYIQKEIDSVKQSIPRRLDGSLDLLDSKTFFKIRPLFRFTLRDILNICGNKCGNTIEKLVFDPEKFDESELSYHLVSRTPLICINKEEFLISPNLLLDSLFINTHYSLLESHISEEYKRRSSEAFIGKISKIASEHGFNEIRRGLELFEGKNSIGDLDIVFKNSADQFLIIEAKNHALPLKVYFNDKNAILAHLLYLQKEWEGKVLRRRQHIKDKHNNYGIDNGYIYIVVSQCPEIISHYSEILMLSLYEFKKWIANQCSGQNFLEIYSSIYKVDNAYDINNFLEKLREDGLFLF